MTAGKTTRQRLFTLTRRAGVALGLIGGWMLAGCSTNIPDHRYRQYSEVTQQWDAATRERVLDQRIELGDTREMVYVALGMPLSQPTLTDDTPSREVWEYLVFETVPPYAEAGGAGGGGPLVSSAQQPEIRAVSMNNIVFPEIGGPPARLLQVEFGPDNRVVAWKLYSDSQGRFIPQGFPELNMPKSPRATNGTN